jgi:hypothetical protein
MSLDGEIIDNISIGNIIEQCSLSGVAIIAVSITCHMIEQNYNLAKLI